MESLEESNVLIYGLVTLRYWLEVMPKLLQNTDEFGDIATTDFVSKRERATYWTHWRRYAILGFCV